MKKKIILTILFILIFIIGVATMMSSVTLGESGVLNYMQHNNGHTSNYPLMLELYATNFRYLGAILSLVGGFGAILTVTKK